MKTPAPFIVITLFALLTGSLAAQSRTFHSQSTSTSLSDVNGRVMVDNMPMIDVLLYVSKPSGKPLVIESGLIEADELHRRVSLQLDTADPLAALEELLKGTGLVVVDSPKAFPERWCVVRSETAIGPGHSFVSLATLNVERRLQQASPIHLEMVPLSMFAPLLEGISGIDVEIDNRLDTSGNPWSPLRVSLHNDSRPLREALADALSRSGLTFDVTSTGIRIRKSQ